MLRNHRGPSLWTPFFSIPLVVLREQINPGKVRDFIFPSSPGGFMADSFHIYCVIDYFSAF